MSCCFFPLGFDDVLDGTSEAPATEKLVQKCFRSLFFQAWARKTWKIKTQVLKHPKNASKDEELNIENLKPR